MLMKAKQDQEFQNLEIKKKLKTGERQFGFDVALTYR